MTDQSIFRYLLLAALLLMGSCNFRNRTLKSEKGLFLIGKQDQQLEKPHLLSGEFEFYWDTLIAPYSFQQKDFSVRAAYIATPSSWTSQIQSDGTPYPSVGKATYRARLILGNEVRSQHLGLYIPKIWSASRVFVNGTLLTKKGGLGDADNVPYYNHIIEYLAELQPETDTLELVVHAVNQDHFLGGLVQPFEIGKYADVITDRAISNSWQLMWLGAIMIIGLYHFILYFFRKKNASTLYFGVICILIGFRLIVFGEHEIYEYLKDHTGLLTYAIQSRVYYMATFGLLPFALAYIHSLYPKVAAKPWLKRFPRLRIFHFTFRYSIMASGIASFLVLVTPERYAALGVPIAMPIVAAIPLVVLIVTLLRASFLKEKETTYQIIGITTMIIAGINDLLHTQGIDITGEQELIPIAFAIFISIQFVIIAKRFSNAFNEVEDLSINLEKKVVQRTQQVTEQKEEIEKQKEKLEDSVRYARRIQRAVIKSEESFQELISEESHREGFIFFQPRDIVSGDFYWFAGLGKPSAGKYPIKIFIAADCTGHGVPGAFMTIMGNDLLNEIILANNIIQPSLILHELDQRIVNQLQKNQKEVTSDGMDITILMVDEVHQKVHFAGAKNPLYRVRNGEIESYKGSIFPIGGAPFRKEKVFHSESLAFNKGDTFYLTSDGFQDQFGGEKQPFQKFMKKKFRELLLEISSLPLDQQKNRLEDAFHSWKGNEPQTDDVIVLGIKL